MRVKTYGLLAAAMLGLFAAGAATAEDMPPVEVVVPVSQWNVTAVAWSPDGRFLVSGGNTGSLYLWNVETGELVRSFVGHDGWVGSIAFAPDSQHFATGGYDQAVRIWRLDQPTPVEQLGPLQGRVAALDFSTDGSMLAAADVDGNTSIWTFGENSGLRTVKIDGDVENIGFDGSGENLIFVARNGARAIDLETMEAGEPFADRFGEIWSAAFLADGTSMLIGVGDGPLSLWDIEMHKMVRSFAGAPASNYWMLVTPDGKTAVASTGTVEDGEEVIYWNVSTGVEIETGTLAERIATLSLSPDGKTVALGVDGGVELRDFATGATLRKFRGATYAGETIEVAADVPVALTAGAHSARVWALHDGGTISEIEGNQQIAGISPDGESVVSGSFAEDGALQIWNAQSGEVTAAIDLEEYLSDEESQAITFSADSSLVAIDMSLDLALIDLATGEPVAALTNDALEEETGDFMTRFEAFAISPDGGTVAVADSRPSVQLRKAGEGWEIVRSLKGLEKDARELRYSPDGNMLAGVDYVDNVVVWNTKNGKVMRKFEVPDDVISGLEFTPDGTLLTARMGENIRIWSIKSGKRVADASFDGVAAEVLYDAETRRFDVLTQGGTIVHLSSGAEPTTLATTLVMRDGGLVTVTPEGFFDGPEDLTRQLRLSSGLNVYPIDSALSALHRPDLVAVALAGDPDGVVAKAAAELDLASLVANADPIGGAYKPVPRNPTHVAIAEAVIHDTPAEDGANVGKLVPGTTVALVAEEGDWSQVARDGKLLGFVGSAALAPLQ